MSSPSSVVCPSWCQVDVTDDEGWHVHAALFTPSEFVTVTARRWLTPASTVEHTFEVVVHNEPPLQTDELRQVIADLTAVLDAAQA